MREKDRRRLSWYELDRQTSEPGVSVCVCTFQQYLLSLFFSMYGCHGNGNGCGQAPRVDHQRAVKEYNRSAADKVRVHKHYSTNHIAA